MTGLAPVPGLPYGASHGFELPYLFEMGPLTGPQAALADRMVAYWTGFARGGAPGAGWPRYRDPAGPVLSLAPGRDGIRPVDAGAAHHCALWDARWPTGGHQARVTSTVPSVVRTDTLPVSP